MSKEEILLEVKKKYPGRKILVDSEDWSDFAKREKDQQEAIVKAMRALLSGTNYPACITCGGEGKEKVVFVSQKRDPHTEPSGYGYSLGWIICESCKGLGRLVE